MYHFPKGKNATKMSTEQIKLKRKIYLSNMSKNGTALEKDILLKFVG
jgi:hypothetical protein